MHRGRFRGTHDGFRHSQSSGTRLARRSHHVAYTAPDPFFPVGSTGLAVEQIEAAKAVCEQCPVKTECLQFALETNQDSGIWGGTSEEERRRLRRAWLRDRTLAR